jgi:hypothetical protein
MLFFSTAIKSVCVCVTPVVSVCLCAATALSPPPRAVPGSYLWSCNGLHLGPRAAGRGAKQHHDRHLHRTVCYDGVFEAQGTGDVLPDRHK